MNRPLHVIMRIKGQETYFDEESYPCWEIGWKKGIKFFNSIHEEMDKDMIEEWEEI